jgi:DNA segregation ATPase FtsK/SpoIIIE-like protein
MNGIMPFHILGTLSIVASMFWPFRWDVKLLWLIHASFPNFDLNPPVGILRLFLWGLSTALPFLVWGWQRKNTIDALLKYLQDAFESAGLINNGRYPSLIREFNTETGSKVLQLFSDGIVVSQYLEKKAVIENKLGVEIESIRQHKQYSKVIELEFSSGPLEEMIHLNDLAGYEDYTFPIGKTRTENVIGDLKSIPHYLFAGMTGKGKSSFIKTMITVLLANNKKMEVLFVDLKGSEGPIFSGHPRVTVALSEKEALNLIRSADTKLNERKEEFQKAKATDFDSYNSKVDIAIKLPRILLVVDEIAQLTPTLALQHHKEIKEASLLLNKIARMGRSHGIHLIIGVQKPDSRNLDTTIKSNTEGVLCFPVHDQVQSRVVLDNHRAMDLGGITGRAVWKTTNQEKIVQTPFLPNEKILNFIEKEKEHGKSEQGLAAEDVGGSGSTPASQESPAIEEIVDELAT